VLSAIWNMATSAVILKILLTNIRLELALSAIFNMATNALVLT